MLEEQNITARKFLLLTLWTISLSIILLMTLMSFLGDFFSVDRAVSCAGPRNSKYHIKNWEGRFRPFGMNNHDFLLARNFLEEYEKPKVDS